MSEYDTAFYDRRYQRSVHAARTVLGIVHERLARPLRSAIDLGCGVGTWLSVLRERGVDDVQGLDGPWVQTRFLAIDESQFRQADLGQPVRMQRRYDLAISLEVAEHLDPSRADGFVDDLVGLSDLVLFSAGIPMQGGVHHVNEQWPDYWRERFARRGYAMHDIVRARIWDDEQIAFWYKQNTFLYAREDRQHEWLRPDDGSRTPALPIRVIHPDHYLERARVAQSAEGGLKSLLRLVGREVARRTGRRGTSAPS